MPHVRFGGRGVFSWAQARIQRMGYRLTVRGVTHWFADLRELLAKASPLRSGDELAGVAAESAEARAIAQMTLAEVPLAAFRDDLVVPYEADEVTRLIVDGLDGDAFAPVSGLTVGEFRDWLLADEVTGERLRELAPGLMPEMVAAVSKLMRVQDLIAVARKVSVVTRFRTTVGLPGRLSTRLQPNHPTDDAAGIAASMLDGLLLGSGDAVIGINPVADSVRGVTSLLRLIDRVRVRYGIPTQSCVLAHVTTQMEAMRRRGHRSTWCFSRSPGRRGRTGRLGSRWGCWGRRMSRHGRWGAGARTCFTSRPGRGRRCRRGRTAGWTSRRSRRGRMGWLGGTSRCW